VSRLLRIAQLALVVLAIAISSCGYKPLRSGLSGSPRVRVTHARSIVPGGGLVALEEQAELGARGELAQWGALANEDGADVVRLTVEIVRIDELSEGATAIPGDGTTTKPIARGVRLRVTARGDVEGEGEPFTTPDLEATEVIAAPAAAGVDETLSWDGLRAAAARTAARKTGALVARAVLGIP
jgi:hypothetical protein